MTPGNVLGVYVHVYGYTVLTYALFTSSSEETPRTLLMDEVEVGKRYEIAITTISGFYRYRLGDVVEVVDFIECCPVVTVMYRYILYCNFIVIYGVIIAFGIKAMYDSFLPYTPMYANAMQSELNS